ncbi:flagellar hook-basal body complex protein [Desulfovibrio sulfodismutans]|uniref:Flagellar hook protein FlgE n=1 Tax=Desulfolutivibrio sulfodismutans TaxID=63561 RepID=A0A7K3NH81_9BACT|nr:flagellar hook-basal body complex protein [Desulfolutivibrio sulfodismutans]NDY55538.1 flagellar hook-basal body complex protein [Desulfolutivibrio sulfodismutans]QLA11441.1 flagellar hook-basal body complex protein [Desulfolutivibrio sulfodismutans DSM 3696]
MGALWTGVTGLTTYSRSISVTSNNLANVNTIGYRRSYALFEDLMSQTATSSSGNSQVGLGVQLSNILNSYQVGGMEATTTSTNMAIQGDRGFFQVRDSGSGNLYYTRAGAFQFDSSGYLVDTNGFRVQGWAVDQDAVAAAEASGATLSSTPTTGGVTDILLNQLRIDGRATSSISVISNLDSTTESRVNDPDNPFFTMFESYNYDSTDPDASLVSNASYQTSLTVYDSEGQQHELTVSYSKALGEDGKEYWEYMVSMDPEEDGRAITAGTSKAGVLMIGTLTFNDDGTMDNMTAFTLSDEASNASSLNSWVAADLTAGGLPEFSATFLSASGGGALEPVTMSTNLGISSANGWGSSMPATAADVGTATSNTLGFNTSDVTLAYNATTNYATTSYTQTTSQNGYAEGYLLDVSVDAEGVVIGNFSNGEEVGLYVVALADFVNPDGLRREGNNLFSSTTEAGNKIEGVAGTGIFDEIAGSTLESSNVDMATEMVMLITGQRALQSNTKVVTTADEMMKKALEIKH